MGKFPTGPKFPKGPNFPTGPKFPKPLMKKSINFPFVSLFQTKCLFARAIEEGILKGKPDSYGKDRMFSASFAFCVITFKPIMI